MKNRAWLGFGGASAVLALVGAGISACSQSSSESGQPYDIYGEVGVSGSVGAGGGGFESTGTGTGEPPITPEPVGEKDAGSDAALTCEGLDKTKPLVLYLSADDSNSMGSPTLAREFLNGGIAPSPGAIRTYEFLNYYRIDYTAPPAGSLSIVPQMEAAEIAGEMNLQIGVRSFNAPKPRRPITITFVLDTSGSMSGPGIERERAAAKAITSSLAEGDVVNMVTWNTDNNTLLSGHKVAGPNDPEVLSKITAIEADGGTDLHSGLVAGYKLAQENYGPGRLNRLILISDAGANVGVTDEEIIAKNSEDADKEGIYLVGIGTGPAGSYNDLLMDVVTDKGRGAYVYLDSPEEAAHMFVDRFDETMEVAARSVQIEMSLPWYFQIHKFYGEEYSENPDEVEPQHLAPSDAMIFNQVLKACDAAEIQNEDAITVTARWKTPITYMKQETSVTMTVGELLAGGKAQLTKGKAIVSYAEALKKPSSDVLKGALAKVNAANSGGTDPELSEIAKLIQKHPQF